MPALDLRPLSLGELLDRTFFLYRRHFLLFTGIAAIPYSLFFVVNLGSTLLTRFRLGSTGAATLSRAGVAVASGGIMAVLLVLVASIAFLFSTGASVFRGVGYLHGESDFHTRVTEQSSRPCRHDFRRPFFKRLDH